MKLRHLPSLCAALLVLCPILATAQTTSAVPGFISYQGRVVDAAGANVGAGTPVNRTVIFRIWDSPSSTNTTNLVYSESQTVTVSEGEFSVLVGQGVANTTQTFSYDETTKKLADLGTAFTGKDRYLGVTVAAAATIATTDNEITPRQQIVSTAFAMRAKFAESIGSSSDLALTPLSGTASNYGLGWYGTGRLFATTAVDGPVLYGNSGGALGSNVSGTQKLALNWDASGRVGIGATSISSATNKLTLQGDMATTPADQLTIRGNADNTKRLLLGYDTTANKAALQSFNGASPAALLLNPSGGNVGVNNTAPSVALEVTGAAKASTSITAGTNMVANGTNGHTFAGTGDTDGGLFSPADGTVTLKTNDAERLRVDASGNVGIGTIAPGFPLNFASTLGDKIALYGSSGAHFGFGIQNNQLQIHTDTNAADVVFGYGTSSAMTETMRIKGSGNVGIGTTTPTVKLEVAGDIKATGNLTANGKSVPVSEESNLRIVRGRISSTGTVAMGTGFTATRTGGGAYTITFSPAFVSEPIITANVFNPPDGYLVSVYTTTASTASLVARNAGGLGGDTAVNFIAIGPR